jgi:hypothetical protein
MNSLRPGFLRRASEELLCSPPDCGVQGTSGGGEMYIGALGTKTRANGLGRAEYEG